MATPIRARPYRGREGNRNDNEESAADIQAQSNPNDGKTDVRPSMSPDIFLNAMRPQGATHQQDAKYADRGYHFDSRGQQVEANENLPKCKPGSTMKIESAKIVSPSQLLKPNIKRQRPKIQAVLEQSKAGIDQAGE